MIRSSRGSAEVDTARLIDSENGLEGTERFRWFLGTTLLPFFAGAYIDQVMLPEVNAGVEWTGRFRDGLRGPLGRALRTITSEQLVCCAFSADAKEASEYLLESHRVVNGVGRDGVRFSALKPENWNWILLSTIMAFQNSYTPITGDKLSTADREQFYQYILDIYKDVQLPGKNSRLPATYREATEYYDDLLARKGQTTSMVRLGFRKRSILMRVLARPVIVCAMGAMRPSARAFVPQRWGRREEIEFRLIGMILPVAYRRLPKRLTLAPLAYHRWKCEKIAAQYRSVRRDSLAPDNPASRTQGCPM